MSSRVPLRDLISDRFLQELHHLLWTEPGVGEDRLDPGWSCRDHAWATALLVQSLGHKPLFVHGEAFFVSGATAKSPGHSITQKPHSWVGVMGVGAIDLSIKPSFKLSDIDVGFPVKCIYANDWIQRGRGMVHFADHPSEFARLTEELSRRRNQAAAVYLTHEVEHVHRGHLTYAAGWIKSLLTRKLDAVYGNPSDLYSALLVHLCAFLEGTASSLTRLPPDEAWARLAEARHGAIDRARLRVESSMAPAREDGVWVAGDMRQTVNG